MNRKTIFQVIIVVLLLVNTVVLVMMWWGRRDKVPNGPAKEYLEKELALNEQQLKTYTELRQAHFATMQQVNRDLRSLKEEFFDHLSNGKNDTTQVHQLAQQIANNEAKKELATFDHFTKLGSILNEQQKTKFDKIIKNVLRMMARPGPGRPPGPPRGERRPMMDSSDRRNGPPGGPRDEGPPGDNPPPPQH
jgi:hypothetical protein